ncbi:hypothetical protein EG329_012579 [Mollisiaceae sp. DMI_Dod_QoI]|nr:hypothetical protein EG329_012579 [Helotiales sp. DMI_Dod_QoI]
MAEVQPRKLSFTDRISLAFRPKKSSNRLRKQSTPEAIAEQIPQTGKRLQYGAVYRPSQDNRDEQTGERRDDTDLLHGLAHHESHETIDSIVNLTRADLEAWRPPGEPMIASLPSDLWVLIASYLSLSDAANLAFSSKTLAIRLGPGPWVALNQPENLDEKNAFLRHMDNHLPSHLLCFDCGTYHARIQLGQEKLKPTLVFNPLYNCPNVEERGFVAPRVRLTPGNTLPYTFVQLVFRAIKYSPNHGIALGDLFRRWKDPTSEWTHQSRYYIYKGHLLMRIVSQSFAEPNLPPSGQRLLLYSREDYTPYFSCCAHWRDGELMNVCKCALGHIPEHRQSITTQLRQGPQIQLALRNMNPIVTLCSTCRPMRRCPECPTEYLVELKLAEDKNDPVVRFKQVITVTRWSDLGDGSSPFTPEWTSINGKGEYHSFNMMGKRAISGIFEAQSGVTMPGQRMLSLNPKNEKLGEEGHGWY